MKKYDDFMRKVGIPAIKKRVRKLELNVREERILREAGKICAIAFEHAASIADRIAREQDSYHGAANTGGAEQVADELRKYSMRNFMPVITIHWSEAADARKVK